MCCVRWELTMCRTLLKYRSKNWRPCTLRKFNLAWKWPIAATHQSEDHTGEKARKRGMHPGFETQDLCSPKFFLNPPPQILWITLPLVWYLLTAQSFSILILSDHEPWRGLNPWMCMPQDSAVNRLAIPARLDTHSYNVKTSVKTSRIWWLFN